MAPIIASRKAKVPPQAERELQEVASLRAAILNSANQAIISTDLEGVVVTFNETAERWLGYSADEVIGKTTPALWHEPAEVVVRAESLTHELGRKIEPGFEVFIAKLDLGKHDESEWTFIRKDRSRFPVLLSVTKLIDFSGKVTGYLGVITDLTARKKMEEELESNRSLLDGFLSNSLDGVIAYSALRNDKGVIKDFRFTLVNPAAERLSKFSKSQLLGHRLLELFPTVAEDGLLQRFIQIVETGKPDEFEYCSNRTDSPHWYRMAGAKQGNGLSVSYTEITERKRAEEKLRASEERFRLIVDGVEDYALFMLDPNGVVASWNSGAERLKGYKADEIIGKHFSCFYTPESIKSGHPESELLVTAREGRYEEEEWRIRKDGASYLAHVVITAIRGDDGALKGFAKIIHDVTESKKFDKALRDQAQILDLANDTIFVRGLDDKICYWNQGAQRVYGWTRQEAVGRVTHELLKTSFSMPLNEITAQLMARGHWEGELEHIRKDGAKITVVSRWALQLDENGKPARVIEMNYDISERKRMELMLHDKNIELQTAARAKNSFLANMSHELRTPLNAIIGFSEILVDGLPGEVNAEQKEYLTDILNSGQHLLQLINDVLDLAKIEAGKVELHPESFRLSKAIEQVCSVAYPLVQKKKIQLATTLAPGIDSVVLDQQKFKQVLYNLLSNAIKFTNDCGRVEIKISARGSAEFTLAVSDTGIGIKQEDTKRLFKEFEQLDEGATRTYQGTGLGLALTRKIVEIQGGSVKVESEFGKGSTFTVVLPLTKRPEDS